MGFWQGKDGEAFWDVGFEPVGEVWGGLFVFGGDGFELVLSGQQIRRIENGAEVVGDFFPHVDFGDEGHGVLLEMELATLPGDTGKASGEGGAETCVVVTDDQAQAVETPGLETGEELAPMDFSFTEFGADAQDGAFALGINADSDENGTGANDAIHADFFITSVHDEIEEGAELSVAPFIQFEVEVSGGATDLGGGDVQTAELFEDGGDFAGGDALDVHLCDGEFEGAFTAEPFFESGGIEGNVATNLRYGEADVAKASGDGFGFEPVGVALASGGAFVGLRLEHLGAFELHGVIDEDAEGFWEAIQTGVSEMLCGGVQVSIFVAVGHIRSFCFWFDRLNRRTGLTRHYHLRRILESISSARLATLAFASLMDSRMEFTEATLHARTCCIPCRAYGQMCLNLSVFSPSVTALFYSPASR